MTYRLEPIIEKIESSVVLIAGDKRLEYKNGAEACHTAFDKHLVISSIRAVGDAVEIQLKEEKSALTESFF